MFPKKQKARLAEANRATISMRLRAPDLSDVLGSILGHDRFHLIF